MNASGGKLIVGITGNFASGKTTVADMLARKGAVKIDADKIGHEILSKNTAVRDRLVEMFGADILEGGDINREKLRKAVFERRENLERVNELMHPLISEKIHDEISKHEEGILLVDAPLLIEKGLDKMVDVVVVVKADYAVQIERAAERGIGEEEAKRIMAGQMPISEKIKFADYVIDNNQNLNVTKKGVDELWINLQST